MTFKGYYVLEKLVTKYGSSSVDFVVSCRDKNIAKDFYDEIKNLCTKNAIRFYDLKNDKELIEQAENQEGIYRFAISWRWMIKNTSNLIILHDSLLPRYRGFAPLVNSLVNGESEIGVTALLAADDYDRGNIVLQKSIRIDYPIKISEAIEKITPLYFEIVDEIWSAIKEREPIKARKQNEEEATYSPWLDEEDYFIDWNWDAEKIKRFVDATGYPYDGAKSLVNNKIVRIIDVAVEEDVQIVDRLRHVGKVLFMKEGCPIVICGKGLIRINKMLDLDRREVSIPFRSGFRKPVIQGGSWK